MPATGYGNCVDTFPFRPRKRVVRIKCIGSSQRHRAGCWRIDHSFNACITELSSICSCATGQLCGVDWMTTGDWYRVDALPFGPRKRVVRIPGVRSSQFCWNGGGWVGKCSNACIACLPCINRLTACQLRCKCGVSIVGPGDGVDTFPFAPLKRVTGVPNVRSSLFCRTCSWWIIQLAQAISRLLSRILCFAAGQFRGIASRITSDG